MPKLKNIPFNKWSYPKPLIRLNRCNMFRKMTRSTLKKASVITYFGKPKSWSNSFYRKIMNYA